MKQLSFIDKQRMKGSEVADFALTLTEDALHARLLCMEAARQLHKCEPVEPEKKKRRKKDETTKPKRKRKRA